MAKIGPVYATTSRFCVPAAISSVTGCTTGEAAFLIRHLTGKKMVTGVNSQVASDVFKMFGLEMLPSVVPDGVKTIGQWIEVTQGYRPPGVVFYICSSSHAQLISEDQYVDNASTEPVSFKNPDAKLRSRIKKVFVITGECQRDPIKAIKEGQQ